MWGQLCRWLPLHQRTLWSKLPRKILISVVSVDQSSVHFLSPLTDFAVDTRTSPSDPQLPLQLFIFFVQCIIISPKRINYYHNSVVGPVALFVEQKRKRWKMYTIYFLPYSAELFLECIIKCWKIEAMEKPREFFIMPKWDFFSCCWCCLRLLVCCRRSSTVFSIHIPGKYVHSFMRWMLQRQNSVATTTSC